MIFISFRLETESGDSEEYLAEVVGLEDEISPPVFHLSVIDFNPDGSDTKTVLVRAEMRLSEKKDRRGILTVESPDGLSKGKTYPVIGEWITFTKKTNAPEESAEIK